jgi:hypothetical protein
MRRLLLLVAVLAATATAQAQPEPATPPASPPAPEPEPPPVPPPAPASAADLALVPTPKLTLPPRRPRIERNPFIKAGALLFGLTYAANFAAASVCFAASCGGTPAHEAWLYAPGFGPLVQFERTLFAPSDIVLGLDALAQLSGIAMLTYGLVTNARSSDNDSARLPFTLAPLAGAGRAGMSVVGRF